MRSATSARITSAQRRFGAASASSTKIGTCSFITAIAYAATTSRESSPEMQQDRCVSVIGAGSWGTTLAKVLADNGRHTLLWTRREESAREINEKHENPTYLPGVKLPDRIEATTDLGRACREAMFVVVVVPS